MSESSNSPTPLSQFPRSTNHLLSPSEKSFIDAMPNEVVGAILDHPDMDISAGVLRDSGVEFREFEGERATAVRDYLDMQFAYGVRRDPRQ